MNMFPYWFHKDPKFLLFSKGAKGPTKLRISDSDGELPRVLSLEAWPSLLRFRAMPEGP